MILRDFMKEINDRNKQIIPCIFYDESMNIIKIRIKIVSRNSHNWFL